jgi:CRP/FNR family cyclic AMP-dependent transcriptional regulator
MGTDEDVVGKLARISFFSDISQHDLRQIAAITEQKSYRKGEIIIEERTAAERFFIIYQGKIEITKRFEDGEEFVLAVQSDGDFFGEMAILDEGLRSATARALEPTVVLEISRTNFETLLFKAPMLAYRIMKELSSRLRETGALLISFLQRRNRQLYRAYLDTLSLVAQSPQEGGTTPEGYAQRARATAGALAKEMGLGEEQLLVVEIHTLLHSIGVRALPKSFPWKPSKLADRIREVAQTYALLILQPARGKARTPEEAVTEIAGSSRPRFDPGVLEALRGLQQTKRLP